MSVLQDNGANPANPFSFSLLYEKRNSQKSAETYLTFYQRRHGSSFQRCEHLAKSYWTDFEKLKKKNRSARGVRIKIFF